MKKGIFLMTLAKAHAALFAALLLTLPASVEWRFSQAGEHGTNLSVPGEALALMAAAVAALRLLLDLSFLKKLLSETSTWLIGAYLLSLVYGAAFSLMPGVSIKFVIVVCVYVGAFYVGARLLLRDRPSHAVSGILLYSLGYLAAVGYTWARHAPHGFSQEFTTVSPRPLYPDDTMYSATAMYLIPALLCLFFLKNAGHLPRWQKLLAGALALVFIVAVLIAGCRAAWLSALAVGGICAFYYLKINPAWFAAVVFLGISFFVLKNDFIQETLRKRADVSLAERLNRYSCALRMAHDRLWTGYGPGTFQFQYQAYQRPEEMTRISVAAPGEYHEGRGGGAHSEYMQALSDGGVPGLLGWLSLLLGALYLGGMAWWKTPASLDKALLAGAFLGLASYAVHAFLNDFLHTDKFAAVFWCGLALTSAYLYNLRFCSSLYTESGTK